MDANLSSIIIDAVVTILVALVSFAFTKYVKPWLERNNLISAAQVAVKAVEALYGRYNGEQKLKAALEQLGNLGFDVDSDEVINAVQSAWQSLNISQIAAGIKSADADQNTITTADEQTETT